MTATVDDAGTSCTTGPAADPTSARSDQRSPDPGGRADPSVKVLTRNGLTWRHNGLTFDQLREANYARHRRRYPRFATPAADVYGGSGLIGQVLTNASALAQAVADLDGTITPWDHPSDATSMAEGCKRLADRLADVVTRIDLVAAYYGIDLGVAVTRKFDQDSSRQGFPEWLPYDGTDPTEWHPPGDIGFGGYVAETPDPSEPWHSPGGNIRGSAQRGVGPTQEVPDA